MQKTKQQLVLLAVLLFTVLVYPFISVANRPANGIPPLYIYLFCIWLVAIALAYFITSAKEKDE